MNVTRQRRRPAGIFASKRLRLIAAAGCALALTSGGIAVASTVGFGNQRVGSTYAGGLQVSDNQVIKPLGDRLVTPFGKIMGSTISPDGRFLAATSTDRSMTVQVFDLSTYKPVAFAGSYPTVAAGTAAVSSAGLGALSYAPAPKGPAAPGATADTACKPGGLLGETTVGQGNPTFSPDGTRLYVPVACGFDVYTVDATSGALSAPSTIFLPATTSPVPLITSSGPPLVHSTIQLPLVAGSVFGPNGHLYAALNGQDAVAEIDPSGSGTLLNQWKVGIAPRQLAFVGGRLYVTNEGGVAGATGTTMQSYASMVAADGTTGSSTTGTVSVIDPANTSGVEATIPVGLHPTALAARGTTLYVANTNSDTVSAIDTTQPDLTKPVQTFDTQPWTGSKVGYQPNALDIVPGASGAPDHLLVSLGRANAIEVFTLGANALDPVSKVGLIPTDYYPSGVFTAADGRIVVANRRGIDARGGNVSISEGLNTTTATSHGTHSTTASLTRFALPSDAQISTTQTAAVVQQNGWTADPAVATTQKVTTCKKVKKKVRLKGKALKKAKRHHRKPYRIVKKRVCRTRTVPIGPNPVPRTIGAKSPVLKHVFLIIKENRTYDQVLGDMKQGNGDASLTQFGAKVTPNQHALATQFGLYDNVYDVGTNSAEGHNWMMMADNPEYLESSAGEYSRSYDSEEDVLGHQRSGFLWNAVQAAGNTARNYGEFLYPEGKPAGSTWQQYYCAAKTYGTSGATAQLTAGPLAGANYGSVIPSLDAISDPLAAPFDTSIPDIYREAIWQQDFKKRLATSTVANFNMLWFSSDHTSGQAAPEAQVADNDLAVGKVVDAISHSAIWKDSVIFVAEDDSQMGVDHVDGHRAPIQVISPYAVHGKTVSTYYSQISMIRTIEQILGATPLNQKVAAATPMFGAFTSTPNLTPFKAVPNKVPLTEGLTGGTPACGNDTLGTTGAAARKVTAAAVSAVAVPATEQPVADAWDDWASEQQLTGTGAVADHANPELMNRYTWYRASNWSTPYPGDSRILAPSEVPGTYVPNPDTD